MNSYKIILIDPFELSERIVGIGFKWTIKGIITCGCGSIGILGDFNGSI